MKKNRENSVEVRLSSEEKQLLKDKAKSFGLTMSEYMRKCVYGYSLNSKTDIQTVFELKKIGVNLNQIAKHVNTLPVDSNIKESIILLNDYILELKNITSKIL